MPDLVAAARLIILLHEQWWQDRAAGRAPALGRYLGRWPEHELLIAREYLELLDGSVPGRAGGTTLDSAEDPGLGPFLLLEELGRGGQGIVYKARDQRLGRTVALKVLHASADPSGAAFLRFQREAAIASRLAHPGICGVLEAGQEAARAWIAMRFVEGESLARRITALQSTGTGGPTLGITGHPSESGGSDTSDPQDSTPRTATSSSSNTKDGIRRIVRFFVETARAVHAAHESGVVHRDLKPGNIMVTCASGSIAGDVAMEVPGRSGRPPLIPPGARPVILDFGLAREESATAVLTASQAAFGTPAYMAPEQIRQDGMPPDRRSDVWALGVTLYEALALRRPFESPTLDGLRRAILSRDAADLRRVNPSVPRDLAVVVAAALEKDRSLRYRTAAALADDLEAALAHRPIAARPMGPFGRALRWARREPAKAAITLLLAAGLPVVAGLGARVFATRDRVREAGIVSTRKRVEALLDHGFIEAFDESPARALQAFQDALHLDPGNVEALAGRAFALRLGGHMAEAVAFLQNDAATGATPALTRLHARLLDETGRAETARSLREGLAPPADAVDHFLAGLALIPASNARDRQASEEALRWFNGAILRSPAARTLHRFYAIATAAAAGRPDEAREHLDALRALKGDITWTRFCEGFIELRAGEPDRAAHLFAEALRLDPGSFRVRVGLGDALREQRDFAAAVPVYEEALRKRPGNRGATKGLVDSLLHLGRIEEAEAIVGEVFRRGAEDTSTHASAGRIHFKRGRTADAITAVRRAVALQPANAGARCLLGQYLAAAGAVEEGLAELSAALVSNPRLREATLALAGLRWKRKDFAGAAKVLEEGLLFRPRDAEMLFNLALARSDGGEPEAALPSIRECLRLDPRHPQGTFLLSKTLGELGDTDGAIVVGLDAMKAGTATAALCYRTGWHLDVAQRTEEAIAAYSEAVRLEPQFAEAWCNLGHALQTAGRFREALPAYRRGHELGSVQATWKYPSETWIVQCEKDAALADELESSLAGRRTVGTPAEWLRLAGFAGRIRRHAEEALCIEHVWRADPALLSDAGTRLRPRAAGAAMRAAQTTEDPTAWRRRALTWLTAELSAIEAAVASGRIRRDHASRLFNSWQEDECFSAVRDSETLAALPVDESAPWRAFWDAVEALLTRLDG